MTTSFSFLAAAPSPVQQQLRRPPGLPALDGAATKEEKFVPQQYLAVDPTDPTHFALAVISAQPGFNVIYPTWGDDPVFATGTITAPVVAWIIDSCGNASPVLAGNWGCIVPWYEGGLEGYAAIQYPDGRIEDPRASCSFDNADAWLEHSNAARAEERGIKQA